MEDNNTVLNFLHDVSFIMKNRNAAKYVIISGNEACDLDSVACSISYSYLLNCVDPSACKAQCQNSGNVCFIPLCKIPKDDIYLRTEVINWIQFCGFGPEDLFYLNDITNLMKSVDSKNISLILVDHFSEPANDYFKDIPVIEIIDHHPIPKDFSKPETCKYFRVEHVGSCSSLIANELLCKMSPKQIPLYLMRLLYGAILIDTIGLSDLGKSLKRATAFDFTVALEIETLLNGKLFIEGTTREDYFKRLESSKFNIQGMSLWDLLRRDMKLISIAEGSNRIACSTLSGLDFMELVSMSHFISTVERFICENNVSLLVCVTVGFSSGYECRDCVGESSGMRRGIVLYAPADRRKLCNSLMSFLQSEGELLDLREQDLRCVKSLDTSDHGPCVFAALLGSKTVTRKQIIPMLMAFRNNAQSKVPKSPIFVEAEKITFCNPQL